MNDHHLLSLFPPGEAVRHHLDTTEDNDLRLGLHARAERMPQNHPIPKRTGIVYFWALIGLMILCQTERLGSAFAQVPEVEQASESEVSEAETSTDPEGAGSESKSAEQDKAVSDAELEVLIEGREGKERLQAIWEDFKRRAALFTEEAKQHRRVQRKTFQLQYQDQSQKIETRYEPPIERASSTEAEQRQESIKQFRSFLESNPSHPQYTPDSLYRLGMLMLEESDFDFVRRVEEYNRRSAEAGDDFDEPFPQRDQSGVVSVFSKLIKEWPSYRELDAALYARGYCFFEMDEKQLALKDFKTIVRRFPESEYRTEVWNLIGELHFDFAELQQAIKAYQEVVKDTESQYYAPAYYKLAWTYYRNDQFEEAVEAFKKLISYSDGQVAQGKKGFDLRDDSMQYLAISLNEDDWDDDGITDADAGFKRVKRYVSGQEGYQAELLEKLVTTFFDNTKYEEAIQTALHLFKKHPNYRKNPQIHAKIVTAYERIAQPEEAFRMRDELTDVYVKGGPWYVYNHTDQEAIDQARGLMKDALLQTGTYHHTRAQSFRERADEGDPADADLLLRSAKNSYQKAALSYQRYLDRYKTDDNTYELLFLFAEALYYSDDYQRSFEQYLVVRDSKLGDERKEESAFSAVLSHIELVKVALASGEFPAKPSLMEGERSDESDTQQPESQGESDTGGLKRVVPEEIPDLIKQTLQVREEYLALGLTAEDEPHRNAIMIYKLGEINLDYLHFPEARKRFVEVIENHKDSPVALNAAILLISTYQIERDWEGVAEWADRIIAADLGTTALAKAKIWKAGALFEKASALEAQRRFEEAAKEYIALVDQNPESEFAVSALNNAAVSFEKARMFDSAMRTYERIFQEFPKSEFAENALFRVAFNAQRFYDYERALSTFQALAKRYPEGERAANAAYNAARLLEQTQQYRAAARALRDYAKRYPDQDNAPECFFDIAKNYEKLGDRRKQLTVYEQFIRLYGKDSKQDERVIIALAEVVKIYDQKGQSRKAKRTRVRLIKEFKERGMKPGSYAARFPAQAAFELIEPRFEAFKKIKIKGNMRQQGKIIKKLKVEISELTEAYAEMQGFKSLEWNIASFYRIGLLRQLLAQTLYDLPIPAGLTPEMEDIYTTQIEELAIPVEDDAVKRFELAYSKAREFKISNEWTKKILASLNKYKPADYPIFKDEKRLTSTEIISTSGFLLPEAAQDKVDVAIPGEESESKQEAQESSVAPPREERSVKVGKREIKGAPSAAEKAPEEGSDTPATTDLEETSTTPEEGQLEDLEELE